MTSKSVGMLESIIERRRPESQYHRRCMEILDNTLPQNLMNELQLVVIEAAAEHEKENVNGHVAILMLSARILNGMTCAKWRGDEWGEALSAMNMYAIQQHLNQIADSKQYDLLAQAVNGFLWQNVYFDAVRGSSMRPDNAIGELPNNTTYYLDILFNHVENTLRTAFEYLTDGRGQLPQDATRGILPYVEETIETVIREATTQ